MNDDPHDVAEDARACRWVLFDAAGRHFALPVGAVDGVAVPPPLARIPHAAPALLGAASLGGRVVPILDLVRLLGCGPGDRHYDGSGEILRVRAADCSVGLWVDRVERLASLSAPAGLAGLEVVDPEQVLAAGLVPPRLRSAPQYPLGDPADRVPPALAEPAAAFVLVEAGGEPVRLPREQVLELVETVPWTPIPRAPPGLLGVALLRDAALPVLCLAALSGRVARGAPGGFAVFELGGRRTLIAVDRVVGLRLHRRASTRRHATLEPTETPADAGEPLDLTAIVPEALRRIVLGFAPVDDARQRRGSGIPEGTIAHLAFTLAGQECAVPIACVDRIVGVRPAVRLPRTAGAATREGAPSFESAIELHGRIVPVAPLRASLASDRRMPQSQPGMPDGYLILRDRGGLVAIEVDRVRHVVRLRPDDVVALPADRYDAIVAVARAPEGGVLQIIAPDRLSDAGHSAIRRSQ